MMADVLVMFRRNPGLIDTVEGIAMRVGAKSQLITKEIAELEGRRILQKKMIGKSEVYFLNRERDAQVQKEVASYISGVKPQ